MKHLVLFCLSIVTSLGYLMAQDARMCTDYDFSPQAFTMLTTESIHPDLNTGTLKVSVPIYEWKDEDFKLPLNLMYSTNGFKPSRPTGIVGLGWSFQLGGVISRQIIGIDDLIHSGYYRKASSSYSSEQLYQLLPNFYYDADKGTTMIGDYETNPDLFHFNFLNHSGSFMIDTMGNFIVFDSNGERGCYEISLLDSSSGMGFRIKTSDGYQYFFGTDSKSIERLYAVNSVNFTATSKGNRQLNSDELNTIAWYLSKIIAPNGRELIFNYSSYSSRQGIPLETDDVSTTFGQGIFLLDRYYNAPESLNKISTYKHPSITTVSYLDNVELRIPESSITHRIITLEYSDKDHLETDPSDNNIYSMLVTRQKKLDKITIANHSGVYLGDARLSYIYKNSRLLLNHLEISNIGNYNFSYNLDGMLPGVLSNALDFWGYYNGRNDNSDTSIAPTEVDYNYDEHIVKEYKNPNSAYSVLGTLKSISYPTGGHTEFEYEANTADRILRRTHLSSYISPETNPIVEMDTTSLIGPVIYQDPFLPSLKYYNETLGFQECGGVRIKAISDFNDTTCIYKRTYSYNVPGTNKTSGIVLKFNRFFSESIGGYNVYNPNLKFPDGSLDKSHMAYSYVTEHFPDSSYVTYAFTDYHMYPDEFSSNKIPTGYNTEYNTSYGNYINNILREPDSRHYRRGRIKSIHKYNKQGDLTFKRDYNYEDSDQSYVPYIIGSGNYWWSARHFTCDFLATNIIDTYYQGGAMTKVRQYKYNELGQMSYEAEMDKDRQNGHGIYYRYCYENSSMTGLNMTKKMPTDIIYTSIRNGEEYVIGNHLFSYDPESINVGPIQIKEYCITTPLPLTNDNNINSIVSVGRNMPSITTTYTYNSQLRLVNISKPGSEYTSYIWDEDVNYIINEEKNNHLNKYIYEWNDMGGISSVTTPSGLKNTYNYDDKNRLETVTDIDGSLIEHHLYHIVNE